MIAFFFSFAENKIDGETFLELSEDDVKSLVKPLGVVKKILRLQKPLLPVCSSFNIHELIY